MKKVLYFFGLSILGVLIFTSCNKDKDESLLVGTWQLDNTEFFERYFSNGDGYSWDEGEDVQEGDAQKFTWSLDGDQLLLIHKMETSNAVIPEEFTISELTSNRLIRQENVSGQTQRLRKVR